MRSCPKCNTFETHVFDKNWKKVYRKMMGNNRLYCRDCKITWKEKDPSRHQKLGMSW